MADELRATLVAIAAHDPYPETIFTPFTPEEQAAIRAALRDSGVRNASDRTYAQWGRHVGARYREMAREALDAG